MDFVLKEDEKIKEFSKRLNSEIIVVNLIKSEDIRSLRKKIDSEKGIVVVEAGSDEINKSLFENKRVGILVGLEKNRERDFMKSRDSGLNQTLCKLANKNKIIIGFSFSDVLNSNGIERSNLLGKMMQNARLCRKYKVKMIVGSFASKWQELRSESDLMAFGREIGIEKVNNKDVISFLENKKDYIAEGVRIIK